MHIIFAEEVNLILYRPQEESIRPQETGNEYVFPECDGLIVGR